MATHDCDDLGLTDDERACLTGFTGRAVRALAHLREAWCVADAGNAAAIEGSIRTLLTGHSLQRIRPICATVLGVDLDAGQRATLLRHVGLVNVRSDDVVET